jgi:Arc/MetJ-type ribon-helix-helix transcriptional regulator
MAEMRSISIPEELHARITEIVARDGFASEADLIAFALRILDKTDLRNQGFDIEDLNAMHDSMEALRRDPSKARTSEQVAATIDAEYRAMLKAG